MSSFHTNLLLKRTFYTNYKDENNTLNKMIDLVCNCVVLLHKVVVIITIIISILVK